MSWAIWRESAAEFGKHHPTEGWCKDETGWQIRTFASEAEAKRVAGVWNATSRTWTYTARLFLEEPPVCRNGHRLQSKNVRQYRGWVICKTCDADRARAYWRERHVRGAN